MRGVVTLENPELVGGLLIRPNVVLSSVRPEPFEAFRQAQSGGSNLFVPDQ
jgi:hypothetical protein